MARPRTKRRLQGEGTLRQRANGIWEARFHSPDGQRHSVYDKSQALVRQKLKEAQRRVGLGLESVGRMTLAEHLNTWLESVSRSLAPATVSAYRGHILNHIVPALGKARLAELLPQQVQAFLNQLHDAGVHPTTVGRIHATLRVALENAHHQLLVERNVARLVKPPKAERPKVNPWSPKEAQAFLQAAQGLAAEPLYTLALYTGLRQGEILGLQWTDIEGEVIHVRRQLRKQPGGPKLAPPKSQRGLRPVPLINPVREALGRQRAYQAQQRLLAGSSWQETSLIFTNSLGKTLDGPTETHRFQQVCQQLGFRRVRFHDLRHAAASLMLESGVVMKVIQDILGHSSIVLTADTYSHLSQEGLRQAGSLMESAVAARTQGS